MEDRRGCLQAVEDRPLGKLGMWGALAGLGGGISGASLHGMREASKEIDRKRAEALAQMQIDATKSEGKLNRESKEKLHADLMKTRLKEADLTAWGRRARDIAEGKDIKEDQWTDNNGEVGELGLEYNRTIHRATGKSFLEFGTKDGQRVMIPRVTNPRKWAFRMREKQEQPGNTKIQNVPNFKESKDPDAAARQWGIDQLYIQQLKFNHNQQYLDDAGQRAETEKFLAHNGYIPLKRLRARSLGLSPQDRLAAETSRGQTGEPTIDNKRDDALGAIASSADYGPEGDSAWKKDARRMLKADAEEEARAASRRRDDSSLTAEQIEARVTAGDPTGSYLDRALASERERDRQNPADRGMNPWSILSGAGRAGAHIGTGILSDAERKVYEARMRSKERRDAAAPEPSSDSYQDFVNRNAFSF